MAKNYEIITMANYVEAEIQHLYFELNGNTSTLITNEKGLVAEVLEQSKKHEQLIKENSELWAIKSKI